MIIPWSRKRRHDDPVVQDFIDHNVPSPNRFVSLIDEHDEMFLFDLHHQHKGDRRRTAIAYYSIGLRILGGIEQIADWHFGSLENVGSFLDFACGVWTFHPLLEPDLPSPHLGVRYLSRGRGISEAALRRQGHQLCAGSGGFPEGAEF